MLDRRVGGVRAGSTGFIYALDIAGQRLAWADGRRRARRPWTPGASFTAHVLAVSELYVRLVEAARTGVIELLRFEAEPACWRAFSGPGGGAVVLKPDAFVRLGVREFEDLWFIEVDRATEAASTLERKLSLYRRYFASGREQARHGVFPRVLLLVPTEGRKGVAIEACARQPAESWNLFQVGTFERGVDVLIGRAPG